MSPSVQKFFYAKTVGEAECVPTLAFCKESEITYVNTFNGAFKSIPATPCVRGKMLAISVQTSP